MSQRCRPTSPSGKSSIGYPAARSGARPEWCQLRLRPAGRPRRHARSLRPRQACGRRTPIEKQGPTRSLRGWWANSPCHLAGGFRPIPTSRLAKPHHGPTSGKHLELLIGEREGPGRVSDWGRNNFWSLRGGLVRKPVKIWESYLREATSVPALFPAAIPAFGDRPVRAASLLVAEGVGDLAKRRGIRGRLVSPSGQRDDVLGAAAARPEQQPLLDRARYLRAGGIIYWQRVIELLRVTHPQVDALFSG